MSDFRRGLRDIRTLTGRVAGASHPYKAYLRISHIEMEKARKTRESDAARQRIVDIASRLEEIEAEKQALLLAMGEKSGGGIRLPAGPRRSTGGFKVRY
ncbi:MAG: hypothetical protein WC443_07705 [Desulfobaccales bacterium]